MAGNPASAPGAGGAQNNPAGQTPDPNGQGGQAGQTGQQQQQNQPGQQQQQQQNQPGQQQQQQQNQPGPILTTDQFNAAFNARWGEEKGKLEKELGLEPGGLAAFIEDYKKNPRTQENNLPANNEKLTGADRVIAVSDALLLAGVDGKKIPGLRSRIQGNTRAEIDADIKNLISAGLLVIIAPSQGQGQQQNQPGQQQQQQQQNSTGAASNPANTPGQPSTKIWTEKEIDDLRKAGRYGEFRDEILKAQSEGRIK